METVLASYFHLVYYNKIDLVELNNKMKELKNQLEEVEIKNKPIKRKRVVDESYKSTEAYKWLGQYNMNLLIGVAHDILAKKIGIEPGRDEKRNKIAMFKWLDDNWDQIKEYKGNVELQDENGDIFPV